jgi:prevent-host-death family protein
MDAVNIYDAKTQLSSLVARAAAGEEIVIGRHGKPLARLAPLATAPRTLRFGVLKGRIKLAADFDAPLPDEVLAAFEGR